MRLTNRTIANLKPRTSSYFVWDDATPGFGVRVSKRGTKSYVVQIKRHGRSKRTTIGRCNSMNCEEARLKAQQHQASVRGGVVALRASLTMQDCIDQYTVGHVELKSEATQGIWRNILKNHIPDALKRSKIENVTRADFIGLSSPALKRGQQGSARLIQAHVRAMLAWCLENEIIERNPMAGVKLKIRNPVRTRFLSDLEIQAWWNASNCLTPHEQAAFKTLIISACRRSEIFDLRWSEIDLKTGHIILPPERVNNTAEVHESMILKTAVYSVLNHCKMAIDKVLAEKQAAANAAIRKQLREAEAKAAEERRKREAEIETAKTRVLLEAAEACFALEKRDPIADSYLLLTTADRYRINFTTTVG